MILMAYKKSYLFQKSTSKCSNVCILLEELHNNQILESTDNYFASLKIG